MIGLLNDIYNRELRWPELFARSMHVFTSIFGSVLKVMLVVFLPISLLEGVILQRMSQTQQYMLHIDASAAMDAATLQNMLNVMMHMLTQEFLLYAVVLFLQPVGAIAIAKMVKQFIDGKKVEAGKAIADALNHMPAIIITGFLFGALVMLGGLVIVPGIYFGIAWGLYTFCIAFEDKKGMDALRASKMLVQGKWLRTAGYLFMLSCFSMLWNSVFQMISSFFGDTVAADLLYQFLCYFSVSFVAVGECLLYLNRKAVADGACVFGTGFVNDFAADDMPAEPVEGTVDGVEEEISLLEEKKEENENK